MFWFGPKADLQTGMTTFVCKVCLVSAATVAEKCDLEKRLCELFEREEIMELQRSRITGSRKGIGTLVFSKPVPRLGDAPTEYTYFNVMMVLCVSHKKR